MPSYFMPITWSFRHNAASRTHKVSMLSSWDGGDEQSRSKRLLCNIMGNTININLIHLSDVKHYSLVTAAFKLSLISEVTPGTSWCLEIVTRLWRTIRSSNLSYVKVHLFIIFAFLFLIWYIKVKIDISDVLARPGADILCIVLKFVHFRHLYRTIQI